MKKTRYLVLLTVLLLSLILVGMALASDITPQSPPANGFTTTTSGGDDLLGYPEKAKPEEPQAAAIPLQAGITGVSTDYGWSQTLGTYTEITGGTQLTTSCDDTNYMANAIPFTFTFNGIAFTQFSLNCNGFIAMGATVISSYTPISAASNSNVIAAVGGDQQTNLTNSEIRYEVLGTTPNRILVIQWKNFRHYAATGDLYNYQIRLYETSNLVEVVYGAFTQNATNRTAEIGLRGATNADFNNRKGTGAWTASTPGTLNNDTMALTSVNFPPSGLTWDWAPIAPHPIFDASYKTAPAQVVIGAPVAYTVHIVNSGTANANAATLLDPIPAGATYNNDVTCSAGTCGFNGTSVTWSGTVAIASEVAVSFSVGTVGIPCGTALVNQATLNDPGLYGGPVIKSASTTLVGTTPTPLEGFEVSVPPAGWTETIVFDPGTDPDWTRESVGTYPTINPHSGSYMAKFNSFSTGSDGSARLWTGALNLSGYATPQIVFWMSHDTGYSANADRLQIQVSTDGTTWVNAGAPVNRYDASCTTACWKEHVAPLPDGYNINGVYIGFLAISAYGNNFYLDDTALTESWYPCPLIAIGPDQTGSACAGTAVQYPLSVQNVNPLADTVDLSALGFTWPTSVDPVSLDLDPGESGLITVTVNVPSDAVPPEEDTATIEAEGQDSGLSGDALITTKVTPPAGMVETWLNAATGDEQSLFWGHAYYYNGEICALGGLTGATPGLTGVHRCYNISADTWSSRPAIPTPVFAGAYGLIGDKFYITGGFIDGAFTGTTLVQIYNITTATWSTGAAMPSARGGAASGIVSGLLYSAGGSGTGSFPADCPTYQYDPVANSWATKAACPLQGGYGFDLGGSVGSDVYGRLFAGGHFAASTGWFAYNPIADSWSTLASLPGGIHKTPLMVENPTTGQIYMIGGMVGWAGRNTTYEYDAVGNTWTLLPDAVLNTTQGGSTGPANGSFGDPALEGFWTLGGTVGSGSISPAPFELWQYDAARCGIPADIEVTPTFLEEDLFTNQTSVQTLDICNNGEAPLTWDMTELSGTLKYIGKQVDVHVPAIMTQSNPASRNPAASFPARDFVVNVDWVSTADINVLLVTPDVAGGGDISLLLSTLAAFPDLIVTVWDGTAGTPSVAAMQSYDVVFVGNDYLWTTSAIDKTVLSNNLADYVDAGGRVVIGSFIWSYDDWGMGGGRFITQDYSPFEIASADIWDPTTLGTFDPTHPLMAGITSITDNFNHQDPVLSSTGEWVAKWADGENFVAVSPNVVGLNQEYFSSAAFGGQVGTLLHNAFLYLSVPPVDVPWLSEDPLSGTVPGVECTVVDVTFDSTGLAVGDYFAGLLIASNDADTPEVTVPVTLTVKGHADLRLVKTASAGEVRVVETITYTLVVTNLGPDTATLVMVEDALPTLVTFETASAGCVVASGVVTCNVGTLVKNAIATVTIVVTANAEGMAENSAEVSSATDDPVPANNTSTVDTTILPAMYYFYLPIVQKQ